MTSSDNPGGDLHDYGQALAEADDRLNRALHETDGDELAAEELLRREEGAGGPAS
jgi:hypothetical protein